MQISFAMLTIFINNNLELKYLIRYDTITITNK